MSFRHFLAHVGAPLAAALVIAALDGPPLRVVALQLNPDAGR